MFYQIVILAILYCNIGGSEGETLAEAITELGPKIRNLQISIGNIIATDRRKLRETHEQIDKLFKTVEFAINNKLEELEAVIQDLEANVATTQIDITPCLEQETSALDILHINDLQLCRHFKDLALIGFNFRDLGVINRQLGRTIKICRAQNSIDIDGLRNCVESRISVAVARSNSIDQQIKNTLDRALEETNNCVKDSLDNVRNGINDIINNLKSCAVK